MSNETNTNNGSGSSKTLIIVAVVAVVVIAVLAFIVFGNQDSTPSEGSSPTPVPPEVSVPTPAPDLPSVTANDVINVRSGPGTNYPVYGVAPAGAQAEVIGVSPDGGWWNISVQADMIPAGNAWVSADYVTAQNTENVPIVPAPPVPPEVVPPPPTEGAPTVTSTDAINVRMGPSNQCTSYGVAPIGASAVAIGISADGIWYQVQIPTEIAPDGLGWVNANYVITSNTENLPVTQSQHCP
ncbi:MAG: SH3 domain-containing protein [Anaerolineales bacterium]|nr:SH3 domain-containing protein [Anaerolineales bacterium]